MHSFGGKRKGDYKKIPAKKLSELLERTSYSRLLTINDLAFRLKLSKPTVIKYILLLNSRGKIPDNNYFVRRLKSSALKKTQPNLANRLLARQERMMNFISVCRAKKIPVSINSLQKKFGGEKRFIKKILDAEEKKYLATNRPLVRRTKSDQPKRK